MMHIFFFSGVAIAFLVRKKKKKEPFNQSTMPIRAIVLSYSRYTSASGPPSAPTEECRSNIYVTVENCLRHFSFQPHTHYGLGV